jgi:hypothetical protein
MTHDDDTCPHLVRANLLEAENARLKAEVEGLMIFCNCTLIPSKELQAKVERLTKAGDAMADMVDWEVPYERRKKLEAEWLAAKEGNGQP